MYQPIKGKYLPDIVEYHGVGVEHLLTEVRMLLSHQIRHILSGDNSQSHEQLLMITHNSIRNTDPSLKISSLGLTLASRIPLADEPL